MRMTFWTYPQSADPHLILKVVFSKSDTSLCTRRSMKYVHKDAAIGG